MDNTNKIPGTITVSTKAVIQAAAHIAKNSAGVIRLTNRSANDKFSNAFHNMQKTKGIYLKKTKNGLAMEIAVVVKYGVNVNDICNTISESVQNELENNMGVKLDAVRVYIESVEN